MVRSQHPGWAPKKIMAEAKKGWEDAALEWMVQTLETCKRKRPRAKWGYFGCTVSFFSSFSFHPAADTCTNAWQILTGTR